MHLAANLTALIACIALTPAALSRPSAIDPALFPHARFVVQIDGLIGPADLAVDAQNRIYIAESGRHRVAVFDLSGRLIQTIGEHGVGALLGPEQVALSGDEVIVTDTLGRRSQVFDRHGEFVRTLDSPFDDAAPAWLTNEELRRRRGGLPGQFIRPGGFARHGNQFVVADTHNHRVQLLDADGAPLAMYTRTSHTPHEGRGALRAPNAVAISPDGKFMAVCEAIEQRCQVFALTDIEAPEGAADDLPIEVPQLYGPRLAVGANAIALFFPAEQKIMVIDAAPPHHLITELGEFGKQFGQFQEISDLRLTASIRPDEFFLSIADQALQRVSLIKIHRSKADPLGLASTTFVKATDASAFVASPGDKRKDSAEAAAIEIAPTGEIRFLDPPASTTYFCDVEHGLVRCIAGDGTTARTIGSRGCDDGQFAYPVDIAVAPDGSIAVLDVGHQRIIFFDQHGNYLHHFGAGRIAPLPKPAWRD